MQITLIELIFFFLVFTDVMLLNSVSYDSAENAFRCPQNCGKIYKTVSSLNKHLKYECNKVPQFKCLFCNKMAKRPDNLKKHMKLLHGYTAINRATLYVQQAFNQ